MTLPASNSIERAMVEQIVRQVLAELLAGKKTTPVPTVALSASAEDQLTLSSKVITAKLLEGRLKGIRRVAVPRGAVFTPAARDELKRFGVTISSSVVPAVQAYEVALHVAVYAERYNASHLFASLRGEGISLNEIGSEDLPPQLHATDLLIAQVQALSECAKKSRALLITDQAALALCLANRIMGVRAVLASNESNVRNALDSLSPNFVVLDPTGRGLFEIQQTLRAWLRHGLLRCPASLKPHLG